MSILLAILGILLLVVWGFFLYMNMIGPRNELRTWWLVLMLWIGLGLLLAAAYFADGGI